MKLHTLLDQRMLHDAMRRLQRTLVNLIMIVASALAAAGIIEFGARLYLSYRPVFPKPWEFRAGGPPPYRDAPYFNREFIEESHRIEARSLDLGSENVPGKYINIAGGFHVTTDEPVDPERRLLLFGASTVANFNVPDNLTVASYLQRLLNQHTNIRWEVRNLGRQGTTVRRQLDLLKRTPLRRNDVIVFYDGGVDIDMEVFRGITITQQMSPTVNVQRNGLQRILVNLYDKFSDRSAAIKVWLDVYSRNPPTTVTNHQILQANVTQMVDSFEATLVQANTLVRSEGGSFMHFLQPSLPVLASPDPYEKSLFENPFLAPAGIKPAFMQGQPALQDMTRRLRAQGLLAFDLTDAFDGRPNGDEIFLDLFHVNHRGNEIIAQRIFTVVTDQIGIRKGYDAAPIR
jgi:lysophospholipase L1-like esterase